MEKVYVENLKPGMTLGRSMVPDTLKFINSLKSIEFDPGVVAILAEVLG
jgi:hypothetical protein